MTPHDRHRLDLAADLAERMQGDVDFSAGARALYSTDASNYRQIPLGVVRPVSVDDAVAAVAVCRAHGVPILSRGGGTAMAGQSTNTAVVIDWSRHLNAVLALDPARRTAQIQPGCVLDTLRDAAGQHGLTFGPDPATHDHCTLGGMIGNNSCGTHSLTAGRTSDNVVRLDVITYDGLRLDVGATPEAELAAIIAGGDRRGDIYRRLRALRDRYADEIRRRYPDIPRRVAGYNLDELLPEHGFNVARALVGTEGTCVTVLEAEVALVEDPPGRALVLLGYPDVCSAGDQVGDLLGFGPVGLEGFDHHLVDHARRAHRHLAGVDYLPEGKAWLLVELAGADAAEAQAQARALMARVARWDPAPSAALIDEPRQQVQIWEVRESALGATARLPDGSLAWTGWEDSAVAPESVGDYLRALLDLYDHYGYQASVYGHFGGGCIHNRLDLDLTSAQGIATYRAFSHEAAALVVAMGGSISGEHGDGQSRAGLLPIMFGAELVRAFEEFKDIWDPQGAMNPGKVVRPARIDEHLRLGTGYQPATPVTFFAFPDDEGSFARASLRCVGVGKCRREGGGTMCPSYMATREEKDSTRGRARLLFEMLQGDVITDGWRSEAVRDALDLCLSCKGCKSECPVNVNMATYKAEFLAHYYHRRLRPAAHYSMGWLPALALGASRAPRLVNAMSHTPGLDRLLKRAGGIAPQRQIPRFAHETFTAWFARRPPEAQPGRPPVLLWPDTFNNHFHPAAASAAVEVLETAGFSVQIPERPLCCGLTWISTGQLSVAKRVLARTVDALAPAVRAGIPVVGLEPSCTAVFRSDLGELFPHNQDAQRLAERTRTLAEVLAEAPESGIPQRAEGRALVQAHCHQRTVMGIEADDAILRRVKADVEILDSGCCGLAGNFGFERGHYDVSMACAERVLLPAVRLAPPETVVVADGFSCRTQIEQATGRRALHLAEVLAETIRAPSALDSP